MNEKSLFEDTLQKRGLIVRPQDFNKFERHCIEIKQIVYKNFEDEMERIGIYESIIWDSLYSLYSELGLIEILNKILESEDLTEKDLRYFINKNKKQLVEDNSSDKENFFNILKESYFNKEPDLFGFFTSRCDCVKEEVLYDLKDETKYSNIDFDLVKKNYKFSSYSSILKDLVDKNLITFFNLINEVYEYHGNLNVNLYNYIWFDIESWIKKNKKLVLKKKDD